MSNTEKLAKLVSDFDSQFHSRFPKLIETDADIIYNPKDGRWYFRAFMWNNDKGKVISCRWTPDLTVEKLFAIVSTLDWSVV